MPNGEIILEARGVSCGNAAGNEAPARLRNVSVSIHRKTLNLLSGDESGGRGLLLRLLGLLDAPDEGEIFFHDKATGALTEEMRAEIRNQRYGFLFAEPYLLPSFSVIENVAMPLFKISGYEIEQARARTSEVLEFVGIGAEADSPLEDLSLLDHHRVSLARALAVGPRVIIAEDAGSHLLPRDLIEFAALLRTVPAMLGIAVIATSPGGAEVFCPDREIRIENGILAADSHPIPACP